MRDLIFSLPLAMFMSSTSWSLCHQHNGQFHCGQGQVESCSGYGVVRINGTHVKGECRVKGDIKINDAQMNTLVSQGNLMVNQTHLDVIKHEGMIDLSAVTVGSMHVSTNKAVIKSSQIKQISVVSPDVSHVYLNGHTSVDQVCFKGSGGFVHIASGAKVREVLGGQVVKKEGV